MDRHRGACCLEMMRILTVQIQIIAGSLWVGFLKRGHSIHSLNEWWLSLLGWLLCPTWETDYSKGSLHKHVMPKMVVFDPPFLSRFPKATHPQSLMYLLFMIMGMGVSKETLKTFISRLQQIFYRMWNRIWQFSPKNNYSECFNKSSTHVWNWNCLCLNKVLWPKQAYRNPIIKRLKKIFKKQLLQIKSKLKEWIQFYMFKNRESGLNRPNTYTDSLRSGEFPHLS